MTHPIAQRATTRANAHHIGLISRISRGLALRAQRGRLTRLDDATLDDIGISRAEAEAEARRPVWDVPANWLR